MKHQQHTDRHDHEPHNHERHSPKKQALISVAVLCFLVLLTIIAILYGRGYRIGFQEDRPQIAKTGILQLTSKPNGAQVYLDDHLTTATDEAINLTPGKYTVKIAKEGYNDWQKDIDITQEVVSRADALLFPKAPTLQSISTLGVESAVVDPSGTKIAFRIASNSAKKNGIYVLEMENRVFPVLAGQASGSQIVDDTLAAFSTAAITWSPDGKQILAAITTDGITTSYLLNAGNFNDVPQDITPTLQATTDIWHEQRSDKEKALLESLKVPVRNFVSDNFRILAWSPDETKILYQASQSADMPVFLKPRLIGNNFLYERRDLEENAIYVYDIKEDINTRIVDSIETLCTAIEDVSCTTPFTWFPDSGHLVYVHDRKIEIVEDDGANMTTIYAGPFLDHYVYPWPDGSKLVILTNLGNQNTPPTLYTISLK
ncbi:MAG TPA: PEGA domain-containing protein [Patescibacteria group bacterium]|nr:PEGA domain-containing protein [Patescibacteria group bacterium]